MRAPPAWFKLLQSTPLLIPSHWALESQHMNFGEDKNIQTIASTYHTPQIPLLSTKVEWKSPHHQDFPASSIQGGTDACELYKYCHQRSNSHIDLHKLCFHVHIQNNPWTFESSVHPIQPCVQASKLEGVWCHPLVTNFDQFSLLSKYQILSFNPIIISLV